MSNLVLHRCIYVMGGVFLRELRHKKRIKKVHNKYLIIALVAMSAMMVLLICIVFYLCSKQFGDPQFEEYESGNDFKEYKGVNDTSLPNIVRGI